MLKFVPSLVVHSKGEGIIVDSGFLKRGYGEQKDLFSGGGSLFVIASNPQSAEYHFTSSSSEQESSPIKGDSIQMILDVPLTLAVNLENYIYEIVENFYENILPDI